MIDVEFLMKKLWWLELDKSAQDCIIEVSNRAIAAESKLAGERTLIEEHRSAEVLLMDSNEKLRTENEFLKSRLTELENQEPAGEIDQLEYSVEASEKFAIAYIDADKVKAEDRLYLQPIKPGSCLWFQSIDDKPKEGVNPIGCIHEIDLEHLQETGKGKNDMDRDDYKAVFESTLPPLKDGAQ